MAPIVLLRLFRADCDFNQATPHPADPIKCRTSTQRTQAPESVDAGRASRLDPLENSIRKEQPFETVTPSIAASEPHGGDNKFGNQRA
jgi:hypothetical protein